MEKNKYSFLIFTCFFLLSCEKTIEFNGETKEPLLVLNSFIRADSIIMAEVSKSAFFLSSNTPALITDATVQAYSNGELIDELEHIGNGRYQLNYCPEVNEEISITAAKPGMNNINASTKIPERTNVISIDTTYLNVKETELIQYVENDQGYYDYTRVGTLYIYEILFKLKFKDPPGIRNYYRLTGKIKIANIHDGYYGGGDYYNDGNIYPDDPIFGSSSNSVWGLENETSNTYNIFSDDLIQGKEYQLKFTANAAKYDFFKEYAPDKPVHDTLFVNLQALNRDYYLYLRTLDAYWNSYGVEIFSEPVQIHSNINGGIGILGSYSDNLQVFVIK